MKKFRYYLAIALVGVTLSACNDGATNGDANVADDESLKNHPVISLMTGNKWIYTIKEIDDDGVQIGSTQFLTYEAVKDTAINGVTTSVYRMGDKSEFLVQNSDGLFRWRQDSLGSLSLQMLYKYPLIPGEKYPLDDGAIVTVLYPKQKINLPFALYECIEIQQLSREGQNVIIEHQYYARDIGLIRSERMVVDGITGAIRNFVQELSSISFKTYEKK